MNEFGEVGIDTEVIKHDTIAVKELLEGCVCCSLQGELEAGLQEIIELYSPDTIIIETTGIAEADNLVVDISDIPNITLDAVITVVDADITNRFPDVKGSAKIQIETADLLLLNKIDLLKREETEQVKKIIKTINLKAPIIETDHCKIDLNILLGIEATHQHITKSEHHHHMETHLIQPQPLNKAKLTKFLNSLPNSIFRVKGYITINNQSFLLNYVVGRWELEETENKPSTLVFIGEKLNKSRINQNLASCVE